jgi:hypothetical protein
LISVASLSSASGRPVARTAPMGSQYGTAPRSPMGRRQAAPARAIAHGRVIHARSTATGTPSLIRGRTAPVSATAAGTLKPTAPRFSPTKPRGAPAVGVHVLSTVPRAYATQGVRARSATRPSPQPSSFLPTTRPTQGAPTGATTTPMKST